MRAELVRLRRAVHAIAVALPPLLVAVVAAPAASQPRDPDLRWRTVETEHFQVHYHEPLGVVARRVASVAEGAHRTLRDVLGHDPDGQTQILLMDHTEGANGSATARPRNEIRLFATAPGDLSTLGDYDDWMTLLVTHEHAHVLHLDNFGGIPEIINTIFGKIYTPNNIQPRWFIEGLATYEESRETSGGRLRSSMFEMFIRMDTLEDRLLTLDQLSNDVDRWPWGNVWYLYGSRFVQFIADRYGHDAIQRILDDYGSATLPYGLNRIARRATGFGFVELYDQFRAQLHEHHQGVAQAVQARGLHRGRRITFHGETARSPRFLDDDTVIYYAADNRSEPQLRTLDATTGADASHLVRVRGQAYMAPHPDGRHVLFSGLDSHRDIYFLYDLFRYDRETGRTERLTQGLRAREPDVAPDGRSMAFTLNGAGTRHLAIADPRNVEATTRVLVRSRRFEQVYTPRYSPDGRTIAYSSWTDGGYRDIRLVDVESGDVRPITDDRALDTGPTWSPDGRWLFFSSDRTGIANIFALELATGRTRQVTNVLGGAYHPAISPDGQRLVYVGYTSRGFDLFTMPLEEDAFLEAPSYADDRPSPSETSAVLATVSERYRPVSTLAPQAYNLELSSGAFGQQVGVNVQGEDIVGWNRYEASVSVPWDEPYVNASLAWRWQRFPIPLTFQVFRRVAPRGGLFVAGERRTWIEDAVGGSIGASYRFPRRFDSESVSLSYSLTHVGQEEPFGGRLDPNDPPPILPTTGLLARLRLGWAFSNVERYGYDVTPSEGRSAAVNLSLSDPLVGSDFQSVSLSWRVAQYIENPWIDHHVLAFRYGGGLGGGDLGRRGQFSVGGFRDVSVIDALIDDVVLGGVALRGYPPFSRSGTQFHLLQAEYRFPLIRPQFGVKTLPFYVNRLYANVFVDYGDAFRGKLDPSTFRVGSGAELLMDFTIGYFIRYTLRTGFAWGFNEGGGAQWYVNLGVPF